MRIISLILLGTALSILVSLALPASGSTWTSNPSRFFLGADVYTETEITRMREGLISQFADGSRPADPKKYAERIISVGRLTEANGPTGTRYYVVPRLHPKLELLIPALFTLAAGVICYAIQSAKKKEA